jgi:hypothetical protein
MCQMSKARLKRQLYTPEQIAEMRRLAKDNWRHGEVTALARRWGRDVNGLYTKIRKLRTAPETFAEVARRVMGEPA